MNNLLAKVLEYSTCELCDGMEKPTAMDSSIKPFTSKKRICGRAVTIELPTASCAKVMEAFKLAQPGDIFIIAAHGNVKRAMWGDYRTRIAKKNGLAGIIIDPTQLETVLQKAKAKRHAQDEKIKKLNL